MSSATLQEQENKQPLLIHAILTDLEDWVVPTVCFSVDTFRPATTSLVLHHAYINRLPHVTLVCQKMFALAVVIRYKAGGPDPLTCWTKTIPSDWGHVLTRVVGFPLGTTIGEAPKWEQRPIGPDTVWEHGKRWSLPQIGRQKKQLISMFHGRELMCSPEQQRDPGITIATINLPFLCISKARNRAQPASGHCHLHFGCWVYAHQPGCVEQRLLANPRKHHPTELTTLRLALVQPTSTVGLMAMQRRQWHQGINFIIWIIVIKRLLHCRWPQMRTRSTMTTLLFPKGATPACPALTLLFLQWKHNPGLSFASSCLIWICLAWSLVQSA